MYKVEAVVKFNSGEALVLNEHPQIKYERHGNYLFGLDKYGIFVNVYEYERPGGRFKAFGGREFDIPMEDGTVIKAEGQWWDAGSGELAKALGSEVVGVTINTKEDLRECYVFHGLRADANEYKKLRNAYTGKVYDYREYEEMLNSDEILGRL